MAGDLELGVGMARGSRQSLMSSGSEDGSPVFGAPYIAYLVLCLLLMIGLLSMEVWELIAPTEETRPWRRTLEPWEEAVEFLLGFALCAEVCVVMYSMGTDRYFKDRFHAFDAFVAGLTLFCGVFLLIRRLLGAAGMGVVLEAIYIPVLALRFAIQPFRVCSIATRVVRASIRSIRSVVELVREPVVVDPRKPHERLPTSILSAKLAAQLREELPIHLRFDQWELAYSPGVHGTSLNTFYSRQKGPNFVVVEDSYCNVFGAFVLSGWCPHPGSYGDPETFVFAVRQPQAEPDDESNENSASATKPTEPYLDIFGGVAKPGQVLQFSDKNIFGVGSALSISNDLLHGSTRECAVFNSPPLAKGRKDFVVNCLECWHVGPLDLD